jgi:peptidoglycan/xylan/chitin deacetylase (PgdA/CDA1 family)
MSNETKAVAAALVAVGLAAGLILGIAAPPASSASPVQPLRVPILIYHRIGDPEPRAFGLQRELACPRPVFRAHLRYFREHGFGTVTFANLRAALQGSARLPPKPVVLTFDDGLDCDWDAFSDLEASGMKGVFFVVSGTLDRPGRLTTDQARRLAGAGMEIGSHSVTHPDLRTLSGLDREREIAESKQDLEALTGQPVLAFAYPGGAYDEGCFAILERAGYSFARTTAQGIAAVSMGNFELDGVTIWSSTDVHRLAAKLHRLQARVSD